MNTWTKSDPDNPIFNERAPIFPGMFENTNYDTFTKYDTLNEAIGDNFEDFL